MIFPVIELEATVQVNDRTRLDARKSYVTPDESAISLIEIEPFAGYGFIDVTSDAYLDWQYTTDGNQAVTVRVTAGGSGPDTFSANIEVVTASNDSLFSNDQLLTAYEPNILNWVREGRNSFLDVHRAAQQRILKVLEENGFFKKDESTITLTDLLDLSEFIDWSRFMVLRMIFEGISNATNDIFHQKALRYKNMEAEARDRARIKVDLDGDGEDDSNDQISLRTIEFDKI